MCDFTLHCMDWNSVAPLLCEFRMSARALGVFVDSGAIAEEVDAHCRHALVLMDGKVIGAARVTEQGKIERMLVLPHECQNQIEAALLDALRNQTNVTVTLGFA
jgi:hypothetical protein